jgi:hypothetical protein
MNWDNKKSNWLFSKRFYDLRVARYWNCSPDEWDTKDEETQAEMIALFNVENKIQAYEQHLRDIKRNGKNRSNRGIRR